MGFSPNARIPGGSRFWLVCGAPGPIRTAGPRLRRAVLYPSELRARKRKLLVRENRSDVLSCQFLSAVQREQLDQKLYADDSCPKFADKTDRRRRRSASGQQVVHDQHALTAGCGVLVNLERVHAVLERVGRAARPRWQLPELTNRRETSVQAIGDRRSEDEATTLDADDDVDV